MPTEQTEETEETEQTDLTEQTGPAERTEQTTRADLCAVCGAALDEHNRLVLVSGRVQAEHCSETCLRKSVRKRQRASAAAERRWLVRLAVMVLLAAGGQALWHRFRAQPTQTIAEGWPGTRPEAAPPPPPSSNLVPFGPIWPPTDEIWKEVFAKTSWVHPLPGPVRRPSRIDDRILGPRSPNEYAPECRTMGHCAVDLGGELWGEHVFAVHDGVVDRVHAHGEDEQGGQYVRLSHFGGMVFTYYFHLAAVPPRSIFRGARVKAGDVIGLVGDTGIKSASASASASSGSGSGTSVAAGRHLHFALSTQPSIAFPEMYWDLGPLMADWPLRVPAHGTVAGYAPPPKPEEPPPKRRSKKNVRAVSH